MGRLMNQPPPAAAPAPAPEMHHFSHPHTLQFSNHQPQQYAGHVSCSGCKLALHGGIYGCIPCNYFLHISCAQMPQQITHPFDPNGHVLFLLPKPIYPEGAFGCDACGKQGSGFSYHCPDCCIDLHINCAAMPLLLTHHSHLHKLDLAFSPPYHNKSFSCDICKKVGSNHWLYRCSSCEFDAHLECATTKTAAAAAPVQQNQMQQIQAGPRAIIPQYHQNPGTQFATRPPLQNSSSGNFANNPNPAVNGPVRPIGSLGNALLYHTVGGLVNGASQALGQNFMQGLLGGGSGGGGGGGSGGGDFNLNITGADTSGGGGGDGGYMVINDNGMEGSNSMGDTQDCNY